MYKIWIYTDVNAETTCLLQCSVFERNVEKMRNNKLITVNLLLCSAASSLSGVIISSSRKMGKFHNLCASANKMKNYCDSIVHGEMLNTHIVHWKAQPGDNRQVGGWYWSQQQEESRPTWAIWPLSCCEHDTVLNVWVSLEAWNSLTICASISF